MASSTSTTTVSEILAALNSADAGAWQYSKTWSIFADHWYNIGLSRTPEPPYPYVETIKTPPGESSLIQDRILITQGYANLYTRIMQAFGPSNIDKVTRARSCVLITGQPGTGKSLFLWYLAIRLLRDLPDEPIMIVGQVTVLCYKGHAFKTRTFPTPLLPESILRERSALHGARCFALVDSRNEFDPSDVLSAYSIYASSCKEHTIGKISSHFHPYTWSIPTWSMKELLQAFLAGDALGEMLQELVEKEGFESNRPLPFHPVENALGDTDTEEEEDISGAGGVGDEHEIATDQELDGDGDFCRPDPWAYAVQIEEAAKGAATAKLEQVVLRSLEQTITAQSLEQVVPPNKRSLAAQRLIRFMGAGVREMGWIPRMVFFFLLNPHGTVLIVSKNNEVDSFLHGQMSIDLMPLLDQANCSNGGHLAHKLFHQHLIVKQPDMIDLARATFRTTFKNEYSEQSFRAEMSSKNWAQLKGLLDMTASSHSSLSHIMNGNIFEMMAHKQVPNSSSTYCCTLMVAHSSTSTTTKWIIPKELDNATDIHFQGGQMGALHLANSVPHRIPSDVYFQGSHTTPLIDAFILQLKSGNDVFPVLYFIQYTSAKTKDKPAITGKTLVEEIYKSAVATIPNPGFSVRFLLVRDRDNGLSNMSWRLPIFNFEHKVYHMLLPIEPESRMWGRDIR
ncbi:hypothetical protein D9757_014077 [Collybiopsis confluens]|uniref:Uncharacterized protein n=1 Tax=Collybiopsis confluens TaxID=2823264 RepID=A0A8H5FQN4_9AGAR|nr:hypothetical protein D9757_014077 [Collybiopsis confluens]